MPKYKTHIAPKSVKDRRSVDRYRWDNLTGKVWDDV